MDYSRLISRAWEITWKYRALWLFGFFAGFAGIGGNFSNIPNYRADSASSPPPFLERPPDFGPAPPAEFFAIFVVVLLAIVIGVVIFLTVLTALGRGGLIGLIKRAEKGGDVGVGAGFSEGLKNILSIIGIWISVLLPFTLAFGMILALLIVPPVLAFLAENTILGVILAIAAVLIGVFVVLPLSIAVGVLVIYAESYRVVQGLGVFASIGEAYKLLRDKLGKTASVWLITFGLAIAFAMVIAIVAALTLIPAISLASKIGPLAALVAIPGVIILVVAGSIFESFRTAIWTLAFLELSGLSGEPAEAEYAI